MAILALFLAEESDKFADLKKIADKIIPSDPWAFLVQLLATFILVLILAKFLVKPARKYISERQAYIQGNLDEANNKNLEADEKLADANKQIKDAKITSKQMIESAKVSALNEKDKIIDDAKNEASLIKEKAKTDIEYERKTMKEQLNNEVVDIALLAASKVVEREVSEKDNQKIIESFINKEDE